MPRTVQGTMGAPEKKRESCWPQNPSNGVEKDTAAQNKTEWCVLCQKSLKDHRYAPKRQIHVWQR